MDSEASIEKRRRLELDVLYHISQAMVHQHDVKALLNEVLDILQNEMALRRVTLTLRSPDSDVFVIEASRGLSKAEIRRGQYAIGEGVTGRVAKTGVPELVPNIAKETKFLDRTKSRKDENVAFLCVPILHRGQTIGTFSIDRPIAEPDVLARDLTYLSLLANVLAEGVASIREQIEEREALVEENRLLRAQLGDRFNPTNIVGNCGTMRHVYEQIAQVADSPATVLVRGESGTGKELVAQAIHYSSPRKNNAFISINCAALPENLIESELFGHEKGSFTGASAQRKGRFELASGGTLFLDEIGDIPASIQVRLLRVLQEKTFERVGGSQTIRSNVRVIAATSVDLEKAMNENRFREDLYYRLNVFPIMLPPLRERRSDIITLADHFVSKYGKMYSRPIKRISSAAINMMTSYHWPGNVRELENCIERSVLTCTDQVIHGYSLPPSLQTSEQTHTSLLPDAGGSLKDMVHAYEREILIDALKRYRGNGAAAARHLHTTQRVLNYRIANLGIDRKKYR